MTTHTRQIQQYTRPTNNNFTKDNLKLATKHTRQIGILQHVQKVKTIPDNKMYAYTTELLWSKRIYSEEMVYIKKFSVAMVK